MAQAVAIGTYVPPWQEGGRRVKGPDEDALTMAVAAGRAADPDASAQRVVMVSRNFPLLEGGNAAVLLAGLSLSADIPVAEVLGGAPGRPRPNPRRRRRRPGDRSRRLRQGGRRSGGADRLNQRRDAIAGHPAKPQPAHGHPPRRRVSPHLCRSAAGPRSRRQVDAQTPRADRNFRGGGGRGSCSGAARQKLRRPRCCRGCNRFGCGSDPTDR